MEGGLGLDVYQYAAGDGNDIILDADGKGVIRYVWRDAGNIEQSVILGDASIRTAADRWTSTDGKIIYTKVAALDAQGATLAGRFNLEINLANANGSTAGGITIKDFDFSAGSGTGWLGIRLGAPASTNAFPNANLIFGGQVVLNSIQNSAGNYPVVTGTVAGDFNNTLYGSIGSDIIEIGRASCRERV